MQAAINDQPKTKRNYVKNTTMTTLKHDVTHDAHGTTRDKHRHMHKHPPFFLKTKTPIGKNINVRAQSSTKGTIGLTCNKPTT
jgi:hypothetical protein